MSCESMQTGVGSSRSPRIPWFMVTGNPVCTRGQNYGYPNPALNGYTELFQIFRVGDAMRWEPGALDQNVELALSA
jgi:hypothetical protein